MLPSTTLTPIELSNNHLLTWSDKMVPIISTFPEDTDSIYTAPRNEKNVWTTAYIKILLTQDKCIAFSKSPPIAEIFEDLLLGRSPFRVGPLRGCRLSDPFDPSHP